MTTRREFSGGMLASGWLASSRKARMSNQPTNVPSAPAPAPPPPPPPGNLTVLSYPTTAATNGQVQLTGTYTGSTVPTAPTASWSTGGAAAVSVWTAGTGRWSCYAATPTSATGALVLTIGGATTGTVTMGVGVVDFAPGLYVPPTLFWSQGNDVGFGSLGGYLTVGFLGTPVVTLGGTDASQFQLNTNTQQILASLTLYQNPTKTSFSATLTATDGITTVTQPFTVLNPVVGTPVCRIITTNVVYDSAPLDPSNLGYRITGMNYDQGGTTLTLADPAGVIQWSAANGMVYVTAGNLHNYGAYPVTIVVNGTYTCTTTFYIAHQRPPIVAWVPGINVYDNTPAMTQVGTVSYYDSSELDPTGGYGNMTLTVPTNPSPGAYIGVTGPVTLVSTPAAGNLTYVFSVAGPGGTTLLSVTIPVGVGTTLASTNLTFTTVPAINNASAWLALPGGPNGIDAHPLLITTMAVSGFARTPTWSILVQTSTGGPENVQGVSPNNGVFGSYPKPRYTFNGPVYTWSNSTAVAQTTATGVSGITLYGSYFSTQTDNVYIICDDGLGTRCTRLIPVVVTAAPGPAIDVGPGQTYTTANALIQAWWGAKIAGTSATFDGAIVTLHPGIVALTDLNYSVQATASGYLNGWWPGPVTLRNLTGSTVRTQLGWQGGTNGSLQSGLVCANFDMTLINLEIFQVNEGGSGSPNAGGVYLTGLLPGNMTMTGCYVYNCDNGLMNGDCTGRHVVVDNCIFERNGTGDNAGSDHNIYVSTCSSFTFSNSQSDCSTDDHCIKSRAMVTTITNSKFRQGAQSLGGGCPVDCPLGGIVNISGCVIITAAQPGNPVFFESGEECGPGVGTYVWPGSVTTITNNTFYDIFPPVAYDGGGSLAAAIAHYTSVVPLDGSPFVTTYSNNSFYNLPAAQRLLDQTNNYPAYYGGSTSPVIDGGGNVSITTYTPQFVIDPLTGIEPINKPVRGDRAEIGWGNIALMAVDSLRLDYVTATAPALGTTVCTVNPVDSQNNEFTGTVTYYMDNSAGGKFVFGAGGAINTATSSTPDGLYFVQAHSSGTGATLRTTATSFITTGLQWIPIIIGNGFVAAS
jgi:hypothetical protein